MATIDYASKAVCYIDQYDNLKVPELGVHVLGQYTLDENVNDHAGYEGCLSGVSTACQVAWSGAQVAKCEPDTRSTVLGGRSRMEVR